jgi:hypothetical protein
VEVTLPVAVLSAATGLSPFAHAAATIVAPIASARAKFE